MECKNLECTKEVKTYGYFCSIDCEVEHTEYLNNINNDSNFIKAEWPFLFTHHVEK